MGSGAVRDRQQVPVAGSDGDDRRRRADPGQRLLRGLLDRAGQAHPDVGARVRLDPGQLAGGVRLIDRVHHVAGFAGEGFVLPGLHAGQPDRVTHLDAARRRVRLLLGRGADRAEHRARQRLGRIERPVSADDPASLRRQPLHAQRLPRGQVGREDRRVPRQKPAVLAPAQHRPSVVHPRRRVRLHLPRVPQPRDRPVAAVDELDSGDAHLVPRVPHPGEHRRQVGRRLRGAGLRARGNLPGRQGARHGVRRARRLRDPLGESS